MKRLKQFLTNLLREDGHDIIEYTLILSFVCLASGALYVSAGNSVHGIWTTASTVLTTGNNADGSGGAGTEQQLAQEFSGWGQGCGNGGNGCGGFFSGFFQGQGFQDNGNFNNGAWGNAGQNAWQTYVQALGQQFGTGSQAYQNAFNLGQQVYGFGFCSHGC